MTKDVVVLSAAAQARQNRPANLQQVQVLRPQNFEQLKQFAEMAAISSMVPASYRDKPADIMLAVQMGSELGLAPMQSLQGIAVVNGRPAVWGDAMIGLCRQSPLCQDIQESLEGEGDAMVAICTAKRHGASPCESRFSVQDAIVAGLWGKDVWKKYPKRMLKWRARGFALRDAFPDVLRGLISVEEAMEIPVGRQVIEGEYESKPISQLAAANVEPSVQPAKQTQGEWLIETEVKYKAATSAHEVDAITASEKVQIALDRFKDGSLARLKAIIQEAEQRWPMDDGEEERHEMEV